MTHALADQRPYWTGRQVTVALVDSRDEVKWNIDAVDVLLRSSLLLPLSLLLQLSLLLLLLLPLPLPLPSSSPFSRSNLINLYLYNKYLAAVMESGYDFAMMLIDNCSNVNII